MEFFNLELNLRPLRIAMVIPANDLKAFEEAVSVNTSLWGGMYNPIIPVYYDPTATSSNSPLSWLGYTLEDWLNVFEPDSIVDFVGMNVSTMLDVPVTKFETPWMGPLGLDTQLGLGVARLYDHLFETEHQFLSRYKPRAYNPAKQSHATPLLSALFGKFGDDAQSKQLEQRFESVFLADTNPVDEEWTLTQSKFLFISPLSVSANGLKLDRTGRLRKIPESFRDWLMFLNADEVSELTTFWNMRALGWNLRPVPIKWVQSCSQILIDFIKEWYLCVGATGLAKACADEFVSKLLEPPQEVLTTSFEDMAKRYLGNPVYRARISAASVKHDARLNDKLEFTFKPLVPEFVKHERFLAGDEWANVIEVGSCSSQQDLELIIPPTRKDLQELLVPIVRMFKSFIADRRALFLSSEGIVMLGRGMGTEQNWSYPSRREIFQWWSGTSQNIRASEVTPKGEIANNLIKMLGGLDGVRWIRSMKVLQKLDQLAHGQREFVLEDHVELSGTKEKRLAYSRTADRNEWLDALYVEPNEDTDEARAKARYDALLHFEILLDRGVLRTGAKLKCAHCYRWSWYLVPQLDDYLRCDHCLQNYEFPKSSPSDEIQWCYKPSGPFSIENFAQGQYTIALALSFFKRFLRVGSAWLPELKLQFGNKETEADFVLWTNQMIPNSAMISPDKSALLLGECKSLSGTLAKKDFDRLETWVSQLPGCTLVIATLADSFGGNEKRGLRKLVNGAAKNNDVILLTGIELLSPWPPPHCWTNYGGKKADAARKFTEGEPKSWTLSLLSKATLDIHLRD